MPDYDKHKFLKASKAIYRTRSMLCLTFIPAKTVKILMKTNQWPHNHYLINESQERSRFILLTSWGSLLQKYKQQVNVSNTYTQMKYYQDICIDDKDS